MDNVIKQRAVIDISTTENWEKFYSGICLVANKELILFLNFESSIGQFDGFTILKNEDFEQYSIWEKDDYKDIKNDNSAEFINQIDVENFTSIESSLKALTNELVAIYTYDDTESYFVGEVLSADQDSIQLKLISETADWLNEKVIALKDINYIGFKTSYEVGLLNKANKK